LWRFEALRGNPELAGYAKSTGVNTVAVFDTLDLDMVEREVAAALFHRHRASWDPDVEKGKLILVYSQLRLDKERENPEAPPLDVPDGIDLSDFEAWERELRMFNSEGEKAMGYKHKLFRKLLLPIVSGGDILNGAPSSPWIEAARMGE
jgi:hypothetical protein